MIFYLIGVVTVMYWLVKATFAVFDWLKIPNPFLAILGLNKENEPPTAQ